VPREPRDSAERQPRSAEHSDADLVRQIATGDSSAFAGLYDRYCRQSFSLAKRICVAQELAEEVVQEVFLALWREPSRFDSSRASFATWLMTLVHHRSVDAVRREGAQRRRATAATDQVAERGETTVTAAEDDALAGIVGGKVREALGRLPEEQRRILSLAYFGGYTQCEVAALTGVPLGTVKSRTFAALRRLRTLLASLRADDQGGDPGHTTGVGR
jgi:RNA polymerase sigma-70 factor (ECF subfamily)